MLRVHWQIRVHSLHIYVHCLSTHVFPGPSLSSDDGVLEAGVSGENAVRLASFLSRAGQVCKTV